MATAAAPPASSEQPRQLDRAREPDDRRQVLAAAAPAPFLAAADPERIQTRAGADPEGAGAARPVQLVRRERDAVRAEQAGTQAEKTERLDGVDVQVRAAAAIGSEQARDLGDRLHGADLVLHQHHGDDRGVRADSGGDRLGAHHPVGAGWDDVQRGAAGDQRLGGAHHRRVLERAQHDVASPGRARRAEDTQRVGLGAAAREDELLGFDVQRRGDGLPGGLEGPAGGRPRGVRRGRIRVVRAGRLGHRRDHFVGRTRRSGVVQIDQAFTIFRSEDLRRLAEAGSLR